MRIETWGVIEYPEAVDRQLELVEQVAAGAPEVLIACTHPPVVTLGRGGDRARDLDGWTGPVVESSRGGKATYHGPSQLVLYPVVDLRRARPAVPARDVHAYLRALEQATIALLSELGVSGTEARTAGAGENPATGVWIGPRKIASIGIAVRKWVTYHGVAVNLWHDPQAFTGIRPCGFASHVMTSVERETGREITDSEEWLAHLRAFTRVFGPAGPVAAVDSISCLS